jgi:hypothetical protein
MVFSNRAPRRNTVNSAPEPAPNCRRSVSERALTTAGITAHIGQSNVQYTSASLHSRSPPDCQRRSSKPTQVGSSVAARRMIRVADAARRKRTADGIDSQGAIEWFRPCRWHRAVCGRSSSITMGRALQIGIMWPGKFKMALCLPAPRRAMRIQTTGQATSQSACAPRGCH